MKSVAIVGGGPAGLVAAKTLLYSHPRTFQVTLFEKSDRIGGLWAVDKHCNDVFMPAEMRTNLSKYTVVFSDLAWESVNIKPELRNGTAGPSSTDGNPVPIFPKAWQVNRYLAEYARRYIPEDVISLSTEVQRAERLEKDGRVSWKIVSLQRRQGEPIERESIFDYLLVGSGFFSKPRDLACEFEGFARDDGTVPLVHSSQYRTLSDVLPMNQNLKGKKLLVVGGANSGGEVAASVAFQMSSSLHSPSFGNGSSCEIIHILPKPIYALPHFVPADVGSRAFLPLDLRFYEMSKRPEDPISFSFGRFTPEIARVFHTAIQSQLGEDKFDLGSQPLVSSVAGNLASPYAVISDNYSEFVRSGAISPRVGRLKRLTLQLKSHELNPGTKDAENGSHVPNLLTATIVSDAEEIQINDIAGVISANGYIPSTALQFLPDEVKATLEYETAFPRLPLILGTDYVTSAPEIPDLGFVGFYEGPYWGVMEMQARMIAKRWATDGQNGKGAISAHDPPESIAKMRDLRDAMISARSEVPQYIFMDYVGIMEQASRELASERNDRGWGPKQGPTSPARYVGSGSSTAEAQKTMDALRADVAASAEHGRFVARAVFRALQGRWRLDRRLESARPNFPGGAFAGEASFHPRASTDPAFALEYLYEEAGALVTDGGHSVPASRRYAYRYDEAGDRMSVWFVKEDGRTVDYLYQTLEFEPQDSEGGDVRWLAKGDHLCEADRYKTTYDFWLRGVALRAFEVKHVVTGPSKDYVSTTRYER